MARDRASILRTAETFLKDGHTEQAIDLYREEADREIADGFYPKAGALLRKILKIRPDDPVALGKLGDIAAREGRVAESRDHYEAAAARMAERGDTAGASEIGARLRAIATAVAVPHIAADIERDDGPAAQARVAGVLAADPAALTTIARVAEGLAARHPAAVAACTDTLVDHALASGTPGVAVDLLRRFVKVLPGHIPVLLRLVEVGSEAGLDGVAREAQAGLADAYLAEGRAHEARVLAEDLVTRDRSDPAHVERLRQSLQLLGVPDADRVIAARLSADIVDPLEFLEEAAAPPVPELEEVFAGLRAEAAAGPRIDAPGRSVSPEDGARLKYDLGDMLETMGENARALAVFLEIEAEAPGFLDVTARIGRLSSHQAGG